MRGHLLLLLMIGAVAADASLPPAPSRAASLSERPDTAAHVIRMTAAQVMSWQEKDTTVFDLRGGAGVYQGGFGVTGNRLLVWFRETGAGSQKQGRVEVYAGIGSVVSRQGKTETRGTETLLRLATSVGIIIEGSLLPAGDEIGKDSFVIRAGDFRLRGPQAAVPVKGPALSEIRYSAEEMVAEDLQAGAAAVTLHGNADVRFQNIVLSADTIRLRAGGAGEGPERARLNSLYAEGAVDLARGTGRITADSLYLDLLNERGLVMDARSRFYIPSRDVSVQVHADALRQLDRFHFEVDGRGYVTTSAFAKPHYRIEGRRIRMVRSEAPAERGAKAEQAAESIAPAKVDRERMVVSSWHNLLYLGPVPVLYWPYVAQDVRKAGFALKSLKVGHSSNLGTYARAKWDLYDLGIYANDWSELTLRTDAFSARGLGAGLDFSYRTPARRGLVRGYYINDTAEDDDRNLPVPRNRRGELTIRHREFLPDHFRLDLELGYLSDRQFLRTYDRKEFDQGKDRETQVFLSRPYNNMMLTAQLKGRLNDFHNKVERQSAAFHLIGQPLFDSRLVWTSHMDISRMRVRTDNDLGLANEDPVTRFDTAIELSIPFSAGPVRLDPYIWNEVTTFSRELRSEDPRFRGASAFGARAAANFYRTFDVHSDLFDVDRLRHVLTPTVDYSNGYMVSRSPGYFVQHDEIDALDTLHRTTLGLHNRMQTYRHVDDVRQQVDFLTFDVDYTVHQRDAGADRGLDDFLEASACWRVTEQIELSSEDNRYNTDERRFDALNGGLELRFLRPVLFGLGHTYYVDVTDAAEPTHSVSSCSIVWQPEFSRWRTEIATTYDFQARRRPGDTKDPRKLGTGIRFIRKLEGWEVTLGADLNHGRASETRFSISVRPPGG